MSRQRFVVANWKMNKSPRETAAFITELLGVWAGLPGSVETALAPAFPALERAGRMLAPTSVALAAQDVHAELKGAYTGEVSGSMLQDLGVRYVLLGHSERRRYRAETEAELARKIERLKELGLAPIYCVGETLEEREGGATEAILTRQMTALDKFAEIPPGLVLAYEPVWAIGTGRSATPQMAAAAHAFLRGLLAGRYGATVAGATRILYGGSVTPANATELFAEVEIDGGLVGGASLKVPDFVAIVRAAG